MNRIILVLVFSFSTLCLKAQVDELKLDFAGQVLDSIRSQKLSVLDSATLKVDNAASKLKSVNSKLTDYDTLGEKLSRVQASIEEKKSQLNSKIDSLKAKNLPFEKYTRKLDSLNNINPMDQLNQAQSKLTQSTGKLDEAQNKIGEGQSKLDALQNKPQQEINDKLGVLSKESNGMGTLPSNVNIPDAKIPSADLNLNTPSLPGIDKPDVGVPSVNAPDIQTDLAAKLNVPEISKPGELEKIGEVQGKIDNNITDVTGKVSGYSEDAKNISKGNIDEVKTLKEDALAKSPVKEEMAALGDADKVLAEQKAMIETMKNPEEFRKQTLARAKKMVVKQMAAQEKLIQATVNKVSKYQSQMGTILGKKNDLPKRRDPLRKLKFYEKFVPGVTFQIQKPGAWYVDTNVSLRYRLTSYWSIGSGWNERLIFGTPLRPVEYVRTFGARTFSEVIIFKGLSMRVDVERMNAFIAPVFQQQDVGERKWVWCYMAGLKKDFTFVKRVTGNVQFMYNLYDPNYYRLYPARFNVRFGFEYPMKRRKKK